MQPNVTSGTITSGTGASVSEHKTRPLSRRKIKLDPNVNPVPNGLAPAMAPQVITVLGTPSNGHMNPVSSGHQQILMSDPIFVQIGGSNSKNMLHMAHNHVPIPTSSSPGSHPSTITSSASSNVHNNMNSIHSHPPPNDTDPTPSNNSSPHEDRGAGAEGAAEGGDTDSFPEFPSTAFTNGSSSTPTIAYSFPVDGPYSSNGCFYTSQNGTHLINESSPGYGMLQDDPNGASPHADDQDVKPHLIQMNHSLLQTHSSVISACASSPPSSNTCTVTSRMTTSDSMTTVSIGGIPHLLTQNGSTILINPFPSDRIPLTATHINSLPSLSGQSNRSLSISPNSTQTVALSSVPTIITVPSTSCLTLPPCPTSSSSSSPSSTSSALSSHTVVTHPVTIVQSCNSVVNPTINEGSSGVVSITTLTAEQLAQQQLQQNIRDMDIVHVQWLENNYETAEGVSLPRSTLYTHYQNHCETNNIEPVNAASFGKLIRSVFVGLRTRRLGTRGNSKYHYYGIRVKPGSSLSRLPDASGSTASTPATPESSSPSFKRARTGSTPTQINANSTKAATSSSGHPVQPQSSGPDGSQTALVNATSPEILMSHLGNSHEILPSVWPDETTISPTMDPDSPQFIADTYAACYRRHYENIIHALGGLNFHEVESLWIQFWQCEPKERTMEHHKGDVRRLPTTLTLEQLHQITSCTVSGNESSTLATWTIQTDYTLYNSIVSQLLLPKLLKPIPQQLIQQIRNFAKNVHGWMSNALQGYDPEFVMLKLQAVNAFSHTLKRYTSLNHLSSAARAVFQNQQQIAQMINDLNKVDFKNVQEQACWATGCDDAQVTQIEMSFKQLLQHENPYDQWDTWCDDVLETCLNGATDSHSVTNFFYKWGFYSSLVMRDLTLRSASSFGSFHLIRLLFDEYIFYSIENRVAKGSAKTALQVLGEARTLRSLNLSGSMQEGPNP